MNSFWEKNKIPLSIIAGALIIGLFIYITSQPNTASVSEDIKSASPTFFPTAQPSITPSPTILPSPTIDDNEAIKKAMAEKLGKDKDSLVVSISKITGQFAKGTVKEKTEVGGAYFLAVKKDGQWIIVYDGQAQPPCKDLNTYNFPKDLAPECLNTSGLVVKR